MQPPVVSLREDEGNLRDNARRVMQNAVDYSLRIQQFDGHWVAPVSADATFTAQYVMFKYQIPGLSLADDGPALRQWLLHDQTADGSWTLGPGLEGNLSTTVEAYLALRLLDLPREHPALQKARTFVLSRGGVAKVRFFTRFFLANFGLFPWKAIPQMPAELILLPQWAKLNIYVLSSWSRSTLIPILVVRHHEPVYALPNGGSPDNDFLDELWGDPSNKMVPFARPLSELFFGPDRDAVELLFTIGDKMLVQLGGLKNSPTRKRSLRMCIDWLFEHQEPEGDWAGFFPPMHGSIWALLLEGFPLHHRAVQLGLEALERLAVHDKKGKWIQSTVSPCWDTALMLNALCDAGMDGQDARLCAAAQWLWDRQLMVSHGDWRIYANTQQAGGWSFEYYNTFYPDVDDAAVVVMTLVKQDPSCITGERIANAVEWILGMQNVDGGWGAFDINNDARWLHKIPFSDMDSLVDPSTSDVTGRMLECFGLLLAHRRSGWRLPGPFRKRLLAASKPALEFLLKEQESTGAARGSWWGRWGGNFNYGTTNVLRGLPEFCHDDPRVQEAAQCALQWLDETQNPDGGWGETLQSYADRSLAGRGHSTAAQTAWAVDSLLRYRSASDLGIRRGIRWLASNQIFDNSESLHGTWPITYYVGTGFPNVLYLGYPFYHHHFPIQALARYIDCSMFQESSPPAVLQLAPQIAFEVSRPSILVMVIGSHGDIEVFLSVAQRFHGCRVRIATHPEHRAVVEQHGFEFYDVGGSHHEFSRMLGEEPNVLLSVVKGNMARLLQSLRSTFRRFWSASVDTKILTDAPPFGSEKAQGGREGTRPFVADAIVSSMATLVPMHAAEKLQIPLVLVSSQPALPTSEFPHVYTMTRPSYSPKYWWNYASYICLDFLNWLSFGSYLNAWRTRDWSLPSAPWLQSTSPTLQSLVPHLCLWSPSILSRPSDWSPAVTIAGYTSLDRSPGYTPPPSLLTFLSSSASLIILISLGSMTIPDPPTFLSNLSSAVGSISVRAIICRSWPAKAETLLPIPSPLYLANSIPHAWLLPRVHGFVHHGGAGHTAAGLRAGIPQLLMPFFLDQHFWAARVAALGLGPPPLEIRKLTAPRLATRLQMMLDGKYATRCAEIAARVRTEGDGADSVARALARELVRPEMGVCCTLLPDLKAYWRHRDSGLPLSGAAAAGLVEKHVLSWEHDLELLPRVDWAEKMRSASTAAGWARALGAGMDLLYLVLGFLQTMFGVVLVLGRSSKRTLEGKKIDPVWRARVRQGNHDLAFIKRQVETKEATAVKERLLGRWHALVAGKFHERFSEGKLATVR